MDTSQLADEIKTILKSEGAGIVDFADLQDLPADVRDGFPYGVSIVVALNPRIIKEIIDGPNNEYYQEYKRANELLDALGTEAAGFLEGLGYRAKSFSATNTGIDPDTLSTILPHKTVATRAGLGWIGKCALLITPEYGSAGRLTSVLTDAVLPLANPKDNSDCGDCHACVDICPGKAVTGREWEAGISRDLLYDPFKCRDVAQGWERKREGVRDNICGMCIAACPWTQKYLDKAG